MQIPAMTLTGSSRFRLVGGLAIAAALAGMATAAKADSAYVAQMPAQAMTDISLGKSVLPNKAHQYRQPSHAPALMLPPEASVVPHAHNFAQTLEIGRSNSVFHLQSGSNNVSRAGVIGSYNNLAVLQSGNNLRSNVVLLNTRGLNVGVLQPKGSAPVNVLIARLPGGGLLIKR